MDQDSLNVRHYCRYRTEDFVVLGHDGDMNQCMLVRLSALPMQDSTELRKIADSPAARKEFYLIPLLQTVAHRTGKDWFTFLAEQRARPGGPIITLPLKEIQDTLEREQRNVFKGYGKKTKGKLRTAADLSDPDVGYESGEEGADETMGSTVNVPSNLGSLDHKLDTLALTIVEENRATQDLLRELIAKLDSATILPLTATDTEAPAKVSKKKA